MGLFDRFKKKNTPASHIMQKSGFFSSITPRVLSGWESSSHSIDYYLKQDLVNLRARSRALVRKNPYGNRFIDVIKSNIVGPEGVAVSAQKSNSAGKPDKRSNDAVERAWKDWCNFNCDVNKRASFVEFQQMAISCAATDGEFIFEKRYTGKYGFQLKSIDAELLDTDKHTVVKGGEIRLGIEYNNSGDIVRYWFREKNHNGDYSSGRSYSIKASNIIHCFVPKFPDQSRGIPWTHAALEATKHLEKYQEGAIVNARASANTFAVLSSKGSDQYTGSEEGTAGTLENVDAGEILDIGDRELQSHNPSYPHQMFDAFIKTNLRSIASGLGISYHSLSNDLEGVNYSSIRAGVLEDRELFKFYQNWLIRSFVRPVFNEWLGMAYISGQILLNGGSPISEPLEKYKVASFQARRWGWVDPLKDMKANQMFRDERLKSRTQIMREQGDDPESVWAEIAKEQEIMQSMGINKTEEKPKEGVTDE